MTTLKPYQVFRYGDVIAQLAQLVPLIAWTWVIHRIYSSSYAPSFSQAGIAIIFAAPYLVVLVNLYKSWAAPVGPYKRSFMSSLSQASLPPGWGYCFTNKVTEEEKKKGILGKYDYKCHGTNMNITYAMLRDMLTRFYYVNYALLLLVITFYNNLSKRIFTDRYVLVCTSLSLLFGVLGVSTSLFATYLSRSVWYANVMSVVLTMNISGLALLIHAIFTRMSKY
jgi:hypothetical protein